MIGIVDYGMGNLHSVSKALERKDMPYFLSADPAELEKADGLILPGVGAFRDAMSILNETGLALFLRNWANEGKPLLGICLGMQLLFESSEEHGLTSGLGFLPGRVERFSGVDDSGQTYKVPHMGWNKLKFHKESSLLRGVEQGHVYFVHSYVVKTDDKDVLLATSEYGRVVPAVVGRENVLGTQFHPEKSSTVGLAILKNYGAYVERGAIARG
ncbi:imidazole glycerol phosphate synthase subunit [Alkalihalophilus pseudofirmus OF4]|uniref:Imidazole glycerol phosphate synthase subunit HisH n=1 Tax=Alkalihalophilus pseudofirmus (strain ATCC BAA-2126 / JCM 17055 / OF4) TaxID=398511 RepID=D3FYB3_ALKPO|nr:imidazole glycerol phosphate synthase subunit HisH [Alkalihalophilus pseudofirmus]ADC49136.1 imidazole glycerol phosphate synthase subunit [Alkalihalophilus pseudofirmus OF4]